MIYSYSKYFLILIVTPYLVPPSMKPVFKKSSMCSDWLAGTVCCDWPTSLSVFQKNDTFLPQL